jgi:hypothetical protein
MNLLAARALRLLVLLLLVGTAFAQAEFSADIVNVQEPGPYYPTLAKIYFAKNKRRLEMQPDAGDNSILITMKPATSTDKGMEMRLGASGRAIVVNLDANTSTMLMAQGKTYYQAPLQKIRPGEVYSLYAFIQPVDVENACVEWMNRPAAKGETCRKQGPDTINGRPAVKYDLSCYGEVCHLWFDVKLHVLLKRESKWSSTELRNIQEGPQPASLFEIPADYAKAAKVSGPIGPSEPQ